MNGDAVKELAQRFRAPMLIDGNLAIPSDWKVIDPTTIPAPSPVALSVYTLGALRDYLKANRDALALDSLTVHVVSPQIVTLEGMLHDIDRSRECYLKATALTLMDGVLDKFMSIEQFVIALQSRFADNEDRKKVLALLSNVKHEAVKTAADDGISQVVTTKAGVAFIAESVVPNPVVLMPYRTFREVRQPSSPFVLRVQAGPQGGLPTVGLFEADGGAWRLDAVAAIRGWLAAELPEGISILA